MIIYSATKNRFVLDVIENAITDRVEEAMVRETGHTVSPREKISWTNSMQFMRTIVEDPAIPEDAGIAIEYVIPATSKRIDFIITGQDENRQKNAVVIELKQWTEAEAVVQKTEMDGVLVKTYLNGGAREVLHPSYQVWSYVVYLSDYHEAIQKGEIQLNPCAYLHNFTKNPILTDEKYYKKYVEKAPLFFKEDWRKLQEFIKKYVKYGDPNLIYEIENGKIKPAKSLANALSSIIQGKKEFVLLDEQKLVYEKALSLIHKDPKQVMIIKGGPGTGKSVVAINLLSEFLQKERVALYVTKNAAPRKIFVRKIAQSGLMSATRAENLFKSSGSFVNSKLNEIDVLIVDEAHRLNAKSGAYQNLGENQIKEIIRAAKYSIFFIDEYQRVTLSDIGSIAEIKKWAEYFDAEIVEAELLSQFRCNGSDGYLAWVDNTLQIRETANFTLEGIDYDFRVYDDPQKMHSDIKTLNASGELSRVVAGYTWNWASARNKDLYDIEIGDYKARWNLKKHGMEWVIHPDSVHEVGCIHTCQGLDLDYVAVIIGPDLVVRNGKIITDFHQRAGTDKSLRGIVTIAREKGEEYAQKLAEPIIKNTYRTLMTRGMKGCFVFSEDEETREYFKLRKGSSSAGDSITYTPQSW